MLFSQFVSLNFCQNVIFNKADMNNYKYLFMFIDEEFFSLSNAKT
jgi:hypothetical protein